MPLSLALSCLIGEVHIVVISLVVASYKVNAHIRREVQAIMPGSKEVSRPFDGFGNKVFDIVVAKKLIVDDTKVRETIVFSRTKEEDGGTMPGGKVHG